MTGSVTAPPSMTAMNALRIIEVSSLPCQRQHDVLPRRFIGSAATACGGGPAKVCGEKTGAAGDRNNNELPAVDRIGRRHPFRRSGKLHGPHFPTVLAIVGAEPAV